VTGVAQAPRAIPSPAARVQPCPTSHGATVTFGTKEPGNAEIRVYDVSGRLVRQLGGAQSMGPALRSYYWDGTLSNGAPAASGVYFFELRVGAYRQAVKLVVSR